MGDQTAYDIHSFLKDGTDSISYKNVRKKFLSLHSKGLIQQTGKKSPHGAKPYCLTTQGLFQYLLQDISIPSTLKKDYQASLLMQNILYQFFEIETLKEFFTIPRILLISDYINHCCERILKSVEKFHTSKIERKRPLLYDLRLVIGGEVNKLIFEIVVTSNFKGVVFTLDNIERSYFVGRDDLFEGHDNKHSLTMYPNLLLKNDKKFMKVLDELKKDFDEGYKNFR
jgi:hypothetical protein